MLYSLDGPTQPEVRNIPSDLQMRPGRRDAPRTVEGAWSGADRGFRAVRVPSRAGAGDGADLAVHPDYLDSAEVSALAGEQGFHSVMDAVGRADFARDLLNRNCKGSTFLVFGVAAPDDVLALTPRDVYGRELTIVGSIISSYTHERAVAMLQSLPHDRIPTRVFPLSEYKAAFAAQRQGRESPGIGVPASIAA